MNVLIAVHDLYAGRVVGGGETFYRKLIESYPNIDFFYPSYDAAAETPPPNATPTQIGAFFVGNTPFDIAATFAGRHFDVIDLPDFYREGWLFLEAFKQMGGRAGTIALSLHGRAADNWSSQWVPASPEVLAFEANNDSMMYRYVDLRYGISRTYIEELTALEGRGGHYLNPIPLYGLNSFQVTEAPGEKPPALLLVGRTNRRKGPDLFVDIVSNIPRHLYSEAMIIGSHPVDAPSNLESLAFRRGIDVNLPGSISHDKVQELFRGRSVLLVPSRRETLSLVTIEALLTGCPTAIAPHLGVARALDDCYPGIPHLRIPLNEPVAAATALADLLRNYDVRRKELVDYLKTHVPIIEGESLHEIYAAPHDYDPQTRALLAREAGGMLAKTARESNNLTAKRARVADPEKPPPSVVGVSTSPLQSRVSEGQYSQLFRYWTGEVPKWMKIYAQLAAIPETTPAELDHKRHFLANVSPGIMLDRVRRTRELSRIERLRGQPLISAAYELRVMRWLGEDRFGALAGVKDTLVTAGYSEEAKAAELMFGPGVDRDHATLDYLRSRKNLYAAPPAADFEVVSDGRKGQSYRASVIVSVYDGVEKLPRFLRTLITQTLFQQGRLEVIIVDSASPGDELGALNAVLGVRPEHFLYLRTRQRETIQCAWNRGIGQARSPYLLFLGVDEELRPDAAELLTDELDKAPDIDWVQASSVILAVDRHGVLERDTGGNDRKWVNGDAQYLDTTYLGHVPGLYRKSLHDRVGLYDPGFRGAGDTEFKNRALPVMKVLTLPVVLGRYINYPEARTTHSCGIEIEDMRAWYLHRTPGGIRYAFGERDERDLAAMIPLALQHQKSYRDHVSSDADLAVLFSDLLAEMSPGAPMLQFREGSHILRKAWQRADLLFGDWPLERTEWIGPELLSREVLSIGNDVARIARAHGRLRGMGTAEDYHFLNDNRCEQHHWVWNA